MNIQSWILDNKPTSALFFIFVLGAAALGYLAWNAWDDYAVAMADYSSKASDLDRLSHHKIFPSVSNLKKLNETLEKDRASLDALRKVLQSYSIPSFGEIEKIKPQDQPQYFQDSLRKQVTEIKNLSVTTGSTLPSSFYLGLDEYENQLPQPTQLPVLSKQLTVFNWIAKNLAQEKGLAVIEFARIITTPASTPQKKTVSAQPVSSSSSLPYETLGSARITLRCDQGVFRDIINTLSSAPYLIIIEDIKIQNSVTEPPRREAATLPEQSTTSKQHLQIIVGREPLNVQLKIHLVNIPVTISQAIQSGVTK